MDLHLYRRLNHTVVACYVVYFLLPSTLFGIERFAFAASFWFATAIVETMRLRSAREMPGMRDYEQRRIAGFSGSPAARPCCWRHMSISALVKRW